MTTDDDIEAVVRLAVSLGYGRGGTRGCVVPVTELLTLRTSSSDEE